MNALEISEPYNTLFKKYGLSSFNDFIDKPIGNLLADEATREIRKFDIEGQTFFLKRVKTFKLSSALEALLQGHKPYSYSYREMIHVQMLKTRGQCGSRHRGPLNPHDILHEFCYLYFKAPPVPPAPCVMQGCRVLIVSPKAYTTLEC